MNQRIKNILIQLYNKLIQLNNPFYFQGIPKCDYTISHKNITLTKLGLSFKVDSDNAVLAGYPYAIKIVAAAQGKFSIENGLIFLAIKDLKFRINSAEELFIIYEVFVTEVYRYNCLRESIFIDIGLNSCITSLYY